MKKWLCSLFIISTVFGAQPRVSVITSVFKGDEFIEGFLTDLEEQTIFNECEFIMINPDSPENEDPILQAFAEKHPNVIYEKLDRVIGIYETWNRAIRMANSEYIMNANLDDRLSPDCLEVLANALDERPDVLLVYSDCYVTHFPNETFEKNRHHTIFQPPAFSLSMVDICFPSMHPMWRKEMHRQFGFFDEWFKAKGDYDMWLRAVDGGGQFYYLPVNTGLCLINKTGISHRPELRRARMEEERVIQKRWGHLFRQAKRLRGKKL